MSCQHGGEVIPSIAIERIISLRDEGIRVYLDGIDKLRKARDLMRIRSRAFRSLSMPSR